MYTLEKNNASPLCVLCTILPQIKPLITLRLVRTWYEESTPWGCGILKYVLNIGKIDEAPLKEQDIWTSVGLIAMFDFILFGYL